MLNHGDDLLVKYSQKIVKWVNLKLGVAILLRVATISKKYRQTLTLRRIYDVFDKQHNNIAIYMFFTY